MDDEATLFGEPEDRSERIEQTAAKAADWQLDLIRKSLDARGIASMEDRQSLIVQHVGRDVASLRELTSEEALMVLNALGEGVPGSRDSRSQWDDRGDATWIDRM